jgi:hypothetical protein
MKFVTRTVTLARFTPVSRMSARDCLFRTWPASRGISQVVASKGSRRMLSGLRSSELGGAWSRVECDSVSPLACVSSHVSGQVIR